MAEIDREQNQQNPAYPEFRSRIEMSWQGAMPWRQSWLTSAILDVGVWPYRAVLGYGTVAMATFLIRVMKHVLFQDKGHGQPPLFATPSQP
jgi:hypothetical protein